MSMRRIIVPGIILALLAAAAFVMFQSEERKTLTAHFPRAVSVYEGSDVRVLGVPVGNVDTVTPSGTDVIVTMSYEAETRIPADAKAVIVAPSVVGDRFVQLTPAYDGGEVLASGETLQEDQTAVPLELDQIYDSIDELNVALGPTGANRNGALSDLLETTAENFGGQGEQFHQTIEDFGKFSQTLENNKEELFGSFAALEGFIGTLARNDQTVRRFNQAMAEVASMLSGEREELRASLRNLATAMGEVSTFVKDNRAILGRNIEGLNRVARVLVKQRGALDQILSSAPLALNNLYMTYNPQSGTLDTRSNQGETEGQIVANPAAFLCGIAAQVDAGEECEQSFPDFFEGARRAPALGGNAVAEPEQFDPTLGGLLEVQR
jgi:phospholipid/cholesterol/gamma-HCH transport system substrate-binding protein